MTTAKRQRVRRAIRTLRFHPNVFARSLRRKRSDTIGLLIPDITNPYFAEAAKGVEDAAERAGLAVLLCDSENDPDREVRYLDILKDRRVDGLLYVTAGDGSSLRSIWRGAPLVVMDREIPGVQAASVTTDNEQGAFAVTRLLLAAGHRRVGFLAGPRRFKPARLRLRGYRRALRLAGVADEAKWIRHCPFTVEGGRLAMEALLRVAPHPTAVVASNDVMALGAIQAAEKAGLRVPDDISVVGFDDIPLAALTRPPLTTVAQPVRRMGEVAVELLVAQLRGKGDARRRVVLEPQVVARQSTGVPRS